MPTLKLQTVEHAFQLLDLFSLSTPELSVVEVSKRLGFSVSNAHRLLNTLKECGVLEQDPLTSRYRLTYKLWQIGCLPVNRHGIRQIARPFLEQLCLKAEETVFLSVLDNTEIVYIDRVDGPHDLRVVSPIGSRLPSYAVSSGLAALAFSPSSVVEAVITKGLTRFTPHTITTPATLIAELARFREQGFAVNVEGKSVGVCGVAAPIFGYSGQLIAVVAISCPTTRIPVDRLDMLGRWVREVAGKITLAVQSGKEVMNGENCE